jgi:hypothetical protein
MTDILRNPPLKSDFDYRVLHLLWPKSLIYCVDFGLKPFNFAKATDEDKEKRVQLVYERFERVLKLAPFNGVTEISPLVTAYRYDTLAVKNNMGDIVPTPFAFSSLCQSPSGRPPLTCLLHAGAGRTFPAPALCFQSGVTTNPGFSFGGQARICPSWRSSF